MAGQQLVGDADELRDAAIDAARAREHIAQAVVEQAFHRREQEPHSTAALKRRSVPAPASISTGKPIGRVNLRRMWPNCAPR